MVSLQKNYGCSPVNEILLPSTYTHCTHWNPTFRSIEWQFCSFVCLSILGVIPPLPLLWGMTSVCFSDSRELARAEQKILVAPTLESQQPKFGPRVTTKKTIWIVAKVSVRVCVPVSCMYFQANDWTTSGGKIREKLTELDFQVCRYIHVLIIMWLL